VDRLQRSGQRWRVGGREITEEGDLDQRAVTRRGTPQKAAAVVGERHLGHPPVGGHRDQPAGRHSLGVAVTPNYHAARTQIIVALLAGVLVAFVIAFTVVRGIMGTLTAVGRVTKALAHGDLTVGSGVTGRDELGRMAAELDTATGTVRGSVEKMSSMAVSLSASAEELSAIRAHL
jgi:methyl-accepting chemotaxis protein